MKKVKLFLLAMISLTLISCENFWNPFKENSGEYTITGSINLDIQGAGPALLKQKCEQLNSQSRTAFPDKDTQDFTGGTFSFEVTATTTDPYYQKTVTAVVNQTDNTFIIKLPRETSSWIVTAKGFYVHIETVGGESVNIKDKCYEGSKTVVVSDTNPVQNISMNVYPFLEIPDNDSDFSNENVNSTGKVNLPIRIVNGTNNVYSFQVKWKDQNGQNYCQTFSDTEVQYSKNPLQQDSPLPLYLTMVPDSGSFTLKPGMYSVTFDFFSTDTNGNLTRVFSFEENVNVFANLTTDTWYNNSNAEYMTLINGKYEILINNDVIKNWTSSVVYVKTLPSFSTDSDRDYYTEHINGSYDYPFSDIPQAVKFILDDNDKVTDESQRHPYTIILLSNITRTEDLASSANAYVDIQSLKPLSLTIMSDEDVEHTYTIDAAATGNTSIRAMYIGQDVTVTLKNIKITGGSYKGSDSGSAKRNGSGIYCLGQLILGKNVTVNDNKARAYNNNTVYDDNVYLFKSDYTEDTGFYIQNKLKFLQNITGTNIGVSLNTNANPTEDKQFKVFTDGFSASADKLPGDYFTSDEGYNIGYLTENGEAVIGLSKGTLINENSANVEFSLDKYEIESRAMNKEDFRQSSESDIQNDIGIVLPAGYSETPRTISVKAKKDGDDIQLTSDSSCTETDKIYDVNLQLLHKQSFDFQNGNEEVPVTGGGANSENGYMVSGTSITVPLYTAPGNYIVRVWGKMKDGSNTIIYSSEIPLEVVDTVNISIDRYVYNVDTENDSDRTVNVKATKAAGTFDSPSYCYSLTKSDAEKGITGNLINKAQTGNFNTVSDAVLTVCAKSDENIYYVNQFKVDCVKLHNTVCYYLDDENYTEFSGNVVLDEDNNWKMSVRPDILKDSNSSSPASYTAPDLSYLYVLNSDGKQMFIADSLSYDGENNITSFSTDSSWPAGDYTLYIVDIYKGCEIIDTRTITLRENIPITSAADLSSLYLAGKNVKLSLSGNISLTDLNSAISDLDENNRPASLSLDFTETELTLIPNQAFKGNILITEVILKSEMSLGNAAFMNCTKLSKVELPEGVTSLGYQAFQGCTSLKSITLPASLTSCEGAFEAAKNLTTFNVADQNTSFSVDSSNPSILYNKDKTKIVAWPSAKGEIDGDSFAGTVNSFEQYAFENSQITKITIPARITSMGYKSFSLCQKLTTVEFENNSGLTAIPSSCFSQCYELSSVVWSSGMPSLTQIYTLAFYECKALESISIPSSVTQLGSKVFLKCTKLNSVTFGEIQGWYYEENGEQQEITVTDVSINATNLTKGSTESPSGLSDKTWKRNNS